MVTIVVITTLGGIVWNGLGLNNNEALGDQTTSRPVANIQTPSPIASARPSATTPAFIALETPAPNYVLSTSPSQTPMPTLPLNDSAQQTSGIKNIIPLCNEEFLYGSGLCWKGILGAHQEPIKGGYDTAWGISFLSDPSLRGSEKFSILSQEVLGLEEGMQLTIFVWVKDETLSGANFRIRAYDGESWQQSQKHTVEAPVGKSWTLVTLHYKVNHSKKMKIILETDGTFPITIGSVTIGQE